MKKVHRMSEKEPRENEDHIEAEKVPTGQREASSQARSGQRLEEVLTPKKLERSGKTLEDPRMFWGGLNGPSNTNKIEV